jgi:glycosyltransferase involved in cell wall biosynthesis
MKILLTVHQFFPEFSAGTEVLTCHTARELKRAGHEVRIVTGYPETRPLADDARFDTYVHDGIPIARFRHQHLVPMGGQTNIVELEYNNNLFATWFRRYLDAWRPDIVHAFHLRRLTASMIMVCRDAGVPVVVTPTDFYLVCPTDKMLLPDDSLCAGPDKDGVNCLRHIVGSSQPKSMRLLFDALPRNVVACGIRVAGAPIVREIPPFSWVDALHRRPGFLRERMNEIDRMIVPTMLMQNILTAHGLAADKISLCRYGIDVPKTPEDSRSSRGAGLTLRVGFIGTLKHLKGAHVLLAAIRALPRDCPVELHVYGDPAADPAYADELHHLSEGEDRIHFRGTFPNDRIGSVLSEIDVLAVPSLWYENTPLVVYSAQAAGCPIIASDLGGLAEVVRDGEDGMLFEAGNVTRLSAAIERLVHDRDYLCMLAANARQPKSVAEYVREIEAIYSEVVDRRRPQRPESASEN